MEAPSLLERLIPVARRREREHVDLAAAPERVWEMIRHEDLARTPVLRALVSSSVLPGAASGKRAERRFCIDDFRPTPREPGFRLLADEPPRQLCVGALARANRLRPSFLHFDDIDEFVAFAEPGSIKLAWSASIAACGTDRMGDGSRLSFEFRIGATDAAAWRMARWYFALIGPGMHWVQRHVLGSLADELGWPKPRAGVSPIPMPSASEPALRQAIREHDRSPLTTSNQYVCHSSAVGQAVCLRSPEHRVLYDARRSADVLATGRPV